MTRKNFTSATSASNEPKRVDVGPHAYCLVFAGPGQTVHPESVGVVDTEAGFVGGGEVDGFDGNTASPEDCVLRARALLPSLGAANEPKAVLVVTDYMRHGGFGDNWQAAVAARVTAALTPQPTGWRARLGALLPR